MKKLIIVFCMGVFFITSVCFSQDQKQKPIKLNEMVVTAQRRKVSVKHISDSITLITRNQIKLKGQTNLFSVLRDIPGVSFKRCGGPGQWTWVSMRGGHNEHIKVLIDGMDISDPSWWGNSFADLWSYIDTEDVERIEIVRGPQSPLYGSGAISGVINIITRKGRGKPKFYINADGGSMDVRRVETGINGSYKGLGYNLNYSYDKSGGVFVHDTSKHQNYSIRLDYSFTDNIKFDTETRYTDAVINYAQWDYNSFHAYDDPHSWRNTYLFFSNTGITHDINPWWNYKIRFAYTEYKKNYDDPDDGQLAPGVFDSLYKGTSKGEKEHFYMQHNFSMKDINTISIGYEYENSHGENKSQSAWGYREGEKSFHTKSIFINDQIFLFNKSLSLSAGGRFDDHSQFGWYGTYKFGLAYLFDLKGINLKIRGNYGTGFKSPSLAQLYDARYGNPNLDPEKSESYDAGFDLSLFQERLKYYFTYFHNDFDDLISFNYNTWRYANISDAASHGIETGINALLTDKLSMRVNYTYTEGWEGNHDDLRITPENEIDANITYSLRDVFKLSTDIYWVDDRLAYDYTHRIDGYTRVDLSSIYKLTRYCKLWFRVENLFDEDYEMAAGYPSPGISVWGGIRLFYETK